jgi:hypothetical protein
MCYARFMNGSEAVQEVIAPLADCGIHFILVGSYSTNAYGIPRSTEDADFVVELSERQGTRVLLDEIRASIAAI